MLFALLILGFGCFSFALLGFCAFEATLGVETALGVGFALLPRPLVDFFVCPAVGLQAMRRFRESNPPYDAGVGTSGGRRCVFVSVCVRVCACVHVCTCVRACVRVWICG